LITGAEIDNLRAALDCAFSPGGDASIGVALTATVVPLWMHLSLLEECSGRVERALAAIAAGAGRDARCEMQLHTALAASLMFTRGAVSEIGAAGTKALEIAESLGNAEYKLRSLWGLWAFHISGGQHCVALTLAQRFYTLAAKRSDPSGAEILSRRTSWGPDAPQGIFRSRRAARSPRADRKGCGEPMVVRGKAGPSDFRYQNGCVSRLI
jgi:hypothetical protein